MIYKKERNMELKISMILMKELKTTKKIKEKWKIRVISTIQSKIRNSKKKSKTLKTQ